jgi:ketosteroid isomerase-like protein
MRSYLILIGALSLALAACGARKENPVENSAQTEQEITALRAAYAAFNRGDIDAVTAMMDPQIEWIEPAEFRGGGTYHGRDGAKQYLAKSRAGVAEIISQPERFITAGDRLVVFVYARVLPKDSKEWRERRLADVYTFRDGKAVAMRAFADRQEALRWVGLESETH